MLSDNEIRNIENDLVSLSLDLILCLNSGLVLSRAFSYIDEHGRHRHEAIYVLLRHVIREAEMKNLSVERELYIIAEKLKSKALLRFALLLIDSGSKGTSLCEKLEKENEVFENARLQRAKAMARKAETKLCFPLTMMLISLIMLCMAPAFMQM